MKMMNNMMNMDGTMNDMGMDMSVKMDMNGHVSRNSWGYEDRTQ
jgi:hypothetical protein